MWQGVGLNYIWRPVSVGRHAFAAQALVAPDDERAQSYCEAVIVKCFELRQASEMDWIREPTCMDCWRVIAARLG